MEINEVGNYCTSVLITQMTRKLWRKKHACVKLSFHNMLITCQNTATSDEPKLIYQDTNTEIKV